MISNKRYLELMEANQTLRKELEFTKKVNRVEQAELTNQIEAKSMADKRALELALREANVNVAQLEARIAESPYTLLTDLLKALAVKLPTINLSTLSLGAKE
jgi:hypothetical protein